MLEPNSRRARSGAARAGGYALRAAAAVAAALLAGCAGEDARDATASGTVDAAAAARLAADGDAQLRRGELLSFACRPCHGLAPGDESPVGPHLYGMFGRRAAQVEGFEYSTALRESGIVWSDETLDRWLAQPETFLPGNDMAFAGFRSAEDRRALIAYLRRQTQPAVDDGADSASVPGDGTSD